MSAKCLKSSALILLHLQTGNWFCHLPEAWRDLQEQDYPVQTFWKALSVSSWHSSREKPSHLQSYTTPPDPVKETSLHVPSCHRAPQQSAGGVCKKRWMWGSGRGRVAFQPGVALCWQLGRSTERLHAEASRQNEKLPHAGTFSVHLLQVCALHWLCLGINPHHWKSFVCSQVLDQQLPFPFSGTGVELASGKRLVELASGVRPLCACMTGYI